MSAHTKKTETQLYLKSNSITNAETRHLGTTKRAQSKKGSEQRGLRTKRAQSKKGAEQKGRRAKRVRDHNVASPLHSRS